MHNYVKSKVEEPGGKEGVWRCGQGGGGLGVGGWRGRLDGYMEGGEGYDNFDSFPRPGDLPWDHKLILDNTEIAHIILKSLADKSHTCLLFWLCNPSH